jgi:hypothetical protein
VVYIAAAEVSPRTMTPFDVAAVRLHDGLDLHLRPPEDVERYLAVLRSGGGARCVAAVADGTLVSALGLRELVSSLVGRDWSALEDEARAAGALIGAYPPA